MPRLRSKPHAVTPLDLVPTPLDGGEDGGRYPEYFPHPYEAELQEFKPEPWQLEVPKEADLVVPQYIDTEADLRAMLQDLTGCREVAIDLEHHSYRTFQGILCLMQLSTRSADYIIDAIALRRRLHLLAPLLADPRVLKVLHGADSDVLWLQRDAGAYVVNMFDTGRAARTLDLPSRGLAYALKEFCGFEADKKHQLGDWRVRPLPPAMLKYAQADTHYLLHVYDRLRAMLGTPEAIAQVLESSRELCLQRYEKEAFDPEGWRRVLQRIGGEGAGALDSAQQARMAALWDWRDALAREEDESPGYVMSAYLMLRLARAAPASHDALVRCAAPLPPLVQQRSDEVIALLAAAAAPAPSPDSVTPGRVGAQRRRGGGSYGRQFSVTPGASVATEGAAPMDVVGGGDGDGEKVSYCMWSMCRGGFALLVAWMV
ncbi:protein in complex with Mn, Zn, and Amp [Tribonema minus]|uniref:Protein in complex with Mn, Zn, and Amp n=1 Tax=Tribonema minus TaxID=303371 RepID=A0A836CIH7_9STRA|nr:protein in complex with Mn, Zn, and Amp [Tribonema minus]